MKIYRIFVALVLCIELVGCANRPRPALGTYRIPYWNGTIIKVTSDFESHTTPKDGMYDMQAVGGSTYIVAAAPGWVRKVVEGNSEPTDNNNFIWIEHPFPYCQNSNSPERFNFVGRPGGKPTNYDEWCVRCEEDFCNEWTVYAHMLTNTASLVGVSEGDWVEAGDIIGIEGNIGNIVGQDDSISGDGRHLHFHVAIMDPNAVSINGYYSDWSDGAWFSSPELEAPVCLGLFGGPPFHYYRLGQEYTAESCDIDRSLGPDG